jgi:hypothetical protein
MQYTSGVKSLYLCHVYQSSPYSESSENDRGEHGGESNSHVLVQGIDVSADCTRQQHLSNLEYSWKCFTRPGGVFNASSSVGE